MDKPKPLKITREKIPGQATCEKCGVTVKTPTCSRLWFNPHCEKCSDV